MHRRTDGTDRGLEAYTGSKGKIETQRDSHSMFTRTIPEGKKTLTVAIDVEDTCNVYNVTSA